MTQLKPHTCGQMPRVQGSTKYEPGLFALYRREVPNFEITCDRCGVSVYGRDYQEAAERWNAMMEFEGRAKVNADNPITWREAYDDVSAKYGSAMRDLYDHAATIKALREKLAKAEARVAELEAEQRANSQSEVGRLRRALEAALRDKKVETATSKFWFNRTCSIEQQLAIAREHAKSARKFADDIEAEAKKALR